MSGSPLEAVAQAIHDADYVNEPWKKFDTLHPDDADHYRSMAAAAIAALELREEWGVVTDMGVTAAKALKEENAKWLAERHDDMTARRRWVSSWTSGSDQ